MGDTSLWCWSISVCSGTNRVWSRVFSCHLFFVSLQSVNARFMRAAQDFVPLFQQGAPGALLT